MDFRAIIFFITLSLWSSVGTSAQQVDSIIFHFPDFSIMQSYYGKAVGVELEQSTIRQLLEHEIELGKDSQLLDANEQEIIYALHKDFESKSRSIYSDNVITTKEREQISEWLKVMSRQLNEFLNN